MTATIRVTLVLVGCLSGCNPPSDRPPAEETPYKPAKLTTEQLPNVVQLHPQVISGGLPEGDAAFEELRQLGVKTIITVDGAAPDVQLARRYGMRYVHLPHGYDGIPQQRGEELTKAVSQFEGPIYIHCHHGKHRSPAAACVASVGAGLIDPEVVPEILELAGTSAAYRGLFQSAESMRPLDKEKLKAMKVEFQEIAPIPPLAEAMVAIEHTHGHLKEIAAANWQSPPDHPDLDPAHEALLLREHYTELLRTELVQETSPEFRQLLRESESNAK